VSFRASQETRVIKKHRFSDFVSAAKQILQGRVRHELELHGLELDGLELNAKDWAGDERGWRARPACGIRHGSARYGAAWSGDATIDANRK